VAPEAAFYAGTDICSCVVKWSHPSVLKHLQKIPVVDVCVSAISQSELLYGAQVSPRREADGAAVDAFLRTSMFCPIRQKQAFTMPKSGRT
jgi:predicted nucleic acid-binding protein